MLSDFCTLDNAGLEERINACRTTARAEVVWRKDRDRRGLKRAGYVRQHRADVPAVNEPIHVYEQILAVTELRSEKKFLTWH